MSGQGRARARARAAAAGVALVAVLWIVGALSVLVTGIVSAQRAELRMAGAARALLVGEAAGQAAIQLELQRMTAGGARIERLTRTAVRYDGLDIVVETMPLTGLLDLNQAPQPLLAAFLAGVGGADERRAAEIAAAVVARREPAGAAPDVPTRFASPEELLSVPGVDYDLFARIADFVTVGSGGGARINPLAAAADMLSFLAAGNAALAQGIARERDAGVPLIDTTRLEGSFIDATVSSRYRFTAVVPMPDGARVLVQRDVDTAAAADAATPWQTLRSATRRVGG